MATDHGGHETDDLADLADLSYTQAVTELDETLDALDRDDVDVDDLARQVRRAARLIRLCRERIGEARVEVEQVIADLSEPPIGPNADATPEATPNEDRADDG